VERQRERKREDRQIEQFQAQLNTANGGARPVAECARIPTPSLPKLGPNSSLETFMTTFETQLRGSGVPEDTWKYHLIGQLDDSHRAKLTDCMNAEDFTYDDLVRRFGRLESETAVSAAERYFAPEADSSRMRSMTEALDVAFKWQNKITEGVDDKWEIVKVLSRARAKTWCTAQLKEYIDQRKITSNEELVARVSQWQALKGDDKPIFAKKYVRKASPYSNGVTPRKGVTCYECGKTGHLLMTAKRVMQVVVSARVTKLTIRELNALNVESLGIRALTAPRRRRNLQNGFPPAGPRRSCLQPMSC